MVKNIFSTFGSKMLMAVMNFFIIIMISQVLGTNGKGEQSFIFLLISVTMIFCDFIGGSAIIFLTPRFEISKMLAQAYAWSTLVCIIAYFIIKQTQLAPGLEIHIFFISILNSFFSIHQNILIGKENFRSNNIISVLQVFILTISLLILFFVFKNASIHAYIVALYFSFGIIYLISLFHVFPYLREQKKSNHKIIFNEALRFGFINQTGIIFQFLSFRLSYFFISQYSGKEVLGVFSNGVSIVESIWLLSISISMVQYGKIVNTIDQEYSKRLTVHLTKLTMSLSAIALVVLNFLPNTFFQFVFGNGFSNIHNVIFYLTPGIFFFNLHLIIGHYFSGIGKYQFNTYAILFGFLVTAIMIFIFRHSFGIFEAGITCSTSYIATSLFIFVCFLKETKTTLADFIPKQGDFSLLKIELKKAFQK